MLSELSELTIVSILVTSITGFDILTKNVLKISNNKINLQNKPV